MQAVGTCVSQNVCNDCTLVIEVPDCTYGSCDGFFLVHDAYIAQDSNGILTAVAG